MSPHISLTRSLLHVVPRLLLAAAAVAGVVLVPAGAASARGGGWVRWQAPTGVVGFCGETPVQVTFPVNREFVRELPLQPGTTDIQEFTGALFVRYTTDSGASVLVNASGPGVTTMYANGDLEIRSRGHYNFGVTPEQAAQLGVPQIFTTSGLIDYVIHPDGSMTPIQVPQELTDECAALGL
jgi:hypothetical protein